MGSRGLRLTVPIKLVLIGVGAWGRRYAETVARRSDCVIYGYTRSSSNHGPANLAGSVMSFYGDSDAVFEDCMRPGGPEGVIISTYPDLHAKLAREAAIIGVPALVEKPLGLQAEDVMKVARSAEAAGNPYVLFVNFIHVFSSAFRAFKQRASELVGAGNEIESIVTEGTNLGPFRDFSTFFDYAPHDLAMVYDLLGIEHPFHVYESRRLPNTEGGEIWESHFHVGYTCVTMRVGNGAARKTRRFEATFSDKTRLIYDDTHHFKATEGGKPLLMSSSSPLDEVLSAYVGAIRALKEGGSGATNLPLAVRVSMSMDALKQAALIGVLKSGGKKV